MALAVLQEMRLSGAMGDRLHAAVSQWLLPAPYANPGLFDVYVRRDNDPDPALSPRAGEYSGKYLISAILIFRMQREPRLRAAIEYSLFKLYDAQSEDGYLGVFCEKERMTGRTPSGAPVADLWNHYYNMLALYLWIKTTNSLQAMERLTRAANFICEWFDPEKGHPLSDIAHPELNFCIMHILALLYRAAGDEVYYDLWKRMSEELTRIEGGENFFELFGDNALSELPKSDATLLYTVESLYTMHHYLHEEHYARTLYAQYKRLRAASRLPNGGFGNMGHAIRSPYILAQPETCSATAWTALCTDTLRAMRRVSIADELELTAFNAALSALHPSGRYMHRYAPMSGLRRPACGSGDLAGAPEFSCCSAEAMHTLGLISQWGVFADEDEVYLNYYGASSIVLQLSSGRLVHITQNTDYPLSGKVTLTVTAQRAVTLHLRIPRWSRDTLITMESAVFYDAECGQYYTIHVPAGTVQLELNLDMNLHYWEGEGDAVGRHAVYRGPILLTFDRHYNPRWTESLAPVFDYGGMHLEPAECDDYYAPLVLFTVLSRDGTPIRLCDYASAGQFGTQFESWLTVRRAPRGSVWL